MVAVALTGTRLATPAVAARLAEAVALGLIFSFAVWLRLWRLDAYTGSFDEGIRSQQLFLMAAGYRPFRDIFASQGPLLLDLFFPFYLVFGQTLAAVRMGAVAFSLIGLIGTWWVGRLVAGPVAGLASALVLALSPTYLESSRLALAEIPTMAPALLAIGTALAYTRGGSRTWLFTSAAFCALSLLIKPMVLHVGAPLVVLLAARVWPGSTPRPGPTGLLQTAIDLVLYAAVVALISVLVVLALGPTQVWDNLGAYRAGAGRQLGADWAGNLRLTALVMRQDGIGLFALAAVGLFLGMRWRPIQTMATALWAAAILGLFLLYGDLADKHVVYLVPPLALVAGIGVGLAWVAGRELVAVRTTQARVAMALGLAAAGVYLWTAPALYRAGVYLIREAPEVAARRRDLAAELDMAAVMQARAGPNEWVLSDNPGAAFRARRPVIPYLVDTSGTRVDAGSLTSELAIDQVGRYRPVVIVTWARRLGRLDVFTTWLLDNGYHLDRTYENGWKLYVQTSTSDAGSRSLSLMPTWPTRPQHVAARIVEPVAKSPGV